MKVTTFKAANHWKLGVASFLGIAVFFVSLFGEFVWDDTFLLANNPLYATFDLWRYLTSPANMLEYLPVRDISYAIDHAIWQFNPFGFHLTNLGIYTLTIAAVYWLALNFEMYRHSPETDDGERRKLAAGVTAALFAVLPIHSESVSFITQRNTLLAGLFTILSCTFFLKSYAGDCKYKYWYYPGSLLLFILALLSKATSIFLPVFLLTLIAIPKPRTLVRQVVSVVPFILIAGTAYALFTTIAKKTGIFSEVMLGYDRSFGARFSEAAQIPYFYIQKLMLPFNLSPDYTVRFVTNPADPMVIIAAMVMLCCAGAVVCFRVSHPDVFICFNWFIISLLPVMHFVPTSTTVADRYAFLPSFAFSYALASTGIRLYKSFPRFKTTVLGAVILTCALYSVLAVRQNLVWKNDHALWEHTATVTPDSQKALENLGLFHMAKKDFRSAALCFEKLYRINPDSSVYAFFQGYLALEKKEYSQAEKWFLDAYFKRANYVTALYFLAKTHDQAGDKARAAKIYQSVLLSNAPNAYIYQKLCSSRLTELSR
jgi:uncharacterized membrane protein